MGTRNARVIFSAQDRASKVMLGISRNLQTMGALAAAVGVTLIGRKMVQGVAEGVRVFKDWDQQLQNTAAVLHKSRGEMVALEKQSKKLGATTQFTARQTAEAQFLLAKAGFSVNEIYAAIPGTLSLAAAGELGMGEAADISAQLIRGFNLEATAAKDVADLLAKTANTANTTVTELGEAFKFAAPASASLGVSLTEASAAIQLVSDRGLKGSLAGTGLAKTFTTLLGSVNKLEGATGLGGLEKKLFTAEGRFVGLSEALKIMRDAGVNSSNVYKIFGERAGKVADILINNIEALDENAAALKDRVGFAAEVAAQKLNSLEGDTIKMQSAMEGLRLLIGEQLNTALRTLVQQVTAVITHFIATSEKGNVLLSILQKVALVVSHVGEAAIWAAQIVLAAWGGMGVVFNQLAAAMAATVQGVVGTIADALEALNFNGVFDGAVEGARRFAEDAGFMAQSFRERTGEIGADTAEVLIGLEEWKTKLREIREKNDEIAASAKAAAEAQAAPEELAGTSADADGRVVGGKGEGASELTPDEAARAQDEVTKARMRALQARAALEQDFTFQQYLMESEAMKLRQEMELERLNENEAAKTELMAAHADERQKFNTEWNAKKIAAEQAVSDAELAIEQRKAQQKRELNEQVARMAVDVLGSLFGASKAAAIGEAIINTAVGVSLALRTIPPPYSYIVAALTAAKGLAEVKTIKKQKAKFQFGGSPGITAGPPGVDNVSSSLTAGELVADTTAAEARRILGGRAAIVPVGAAGAGGGGVTFIVNGDVLDPDEFFIRHAQSVGRSIERLQSEGGVI